LAQRLHGFDLLKLVTGFPDTLDNTAASALLAHLLEERTLLPPEKCTAMLRSGEAMTEKPRA